MKKILSSLFISGIVFLNIAVFGPTTAYATTRTGSVGHLIARDTRPCVFFTIKGVREADPAALLNNPYFAVRESHPGFWTIYGMLLTAKAKGTKIRVITFGRGVSTCSGIAEVSQVSMP